MYKNETSKLKALSDIASIDITSEFNDILQHILKITCEAMNAHSGTIMLVDEGDSTLRMVASYGLPHDYIEMVYEAAKNEGVPLTSSPSGTVLETGKYYLVPNIFKEPKDRPWWKLSNELGFSSQIFTPMKRGMKVIGLLNVYMEKPHSFTDEEINFVTIAASQASSVVQNARMCAHLKNNILELKGYKENLEEKIKEANRELYDSQQYLKMIIEDSFDGIGVVDENGCFEFGNDNFIKILGWQREEIIGQFFIKVFPENMRESMLERWNEVQNGIESPIETKIMTKSGEIRNLYVSHARAEIKRKRKYIVVIKDVTELKKLELNLKEPNKQLKLLQYLMEGTRGGNTRALILKHLNERPYNANQLAETLNLDYKTVRHHLDVLLKNGIITKKSEGHYAIYYLSKSVETNLNDFNREFKKA